MEADGAVNRVVRRYRVAGQVQGVGFRWFVRERARAADVAGVVFNEADGSVVVDVAATPEQIMRIEDAIARGPNGAVVDDVSIVLDGDAAQSTLHELPYPFTIRR